MYQQLSKEVNVLDMMMIVWQGKWKVLIFSILFFIISIFYILIENKTFFNSVTKIKHISQLEIQEYKYVNNFMNNLITNENLRDTYITELEKRDVIKQGIIKIDLLNKRDFKDKASFDKAVISMSNEIKIMRPLKIYQTLNNDFFNLPSIQMHYYDKNKWINFLKFIHTETNEKVRVIIEEEIKKEISFLEKKNQYKVEDLEFRINNLKNFNEKKIKNKIAFLEDQYEIARIAGIKTNNNFYYRNLLQDDLYFLRGYLVIKKEIETIKSRKNIFWDKNVIDLENQLYLYKKNPYMKKIKQVFKSSPIYNKKNFKAVIFEPEKTQFIVKNTKQLIVILSVIFGSILGLIYVLVNALFINKNEAT